MQTKLTTLAVAVALTAMATLPAQAANTTGAPMPNKFWWPDQLDLSCCERTTPARTRWARTSITRRSSPSST